MDGMKNTIFALPVVAAVCGGCLFAGSDSAPADVVMRPDGDVRTLSAAIERVRAMRASGAIPAGRTAEVRVEEGRYAVKEAAVFGPADSNIRFAAAKKGRAVFDGGVELPPFKAGADGVWRARVPDGLDFEQLFVNGRRAQRARTPNKFYHYMVEPWDESRNPKTGATGDFSRCVFIAEKGDIVDLAKLSPEDLSRVEIQFWQSWDMARTRVEWVDGEKGIVLVTGGTSRPLFFWSSTRPRYALENYRAALDAPGEWFLDAKARELLYIPLDGETPESTRAVAPVAKGFVVLAGDPLKDEIVRDVSFTGLAFENSAWPLPPQGARNAQSAQNFHDSAVLADGAERFTMESCRLSHIGLHGVWLKRGCRNCRVSHCYIEDLGGGGVYLGATDNWRTDKPGRLSAFNVVTDCIIRGGGHILNGAIGVWVGHSSDNEISHNDIGDFRYTGVSMGWTWGYSPTVAKRNRLLWNRIHHIGQGVLSDMGGVYTLGDSEGTVEIGNWIHDVNGYAGTGSPAWGLYTDEGSRGILHASNLVERCRDGAVHQHYGRENVFANNIFATFDRNGVWRSRVEDHTTIIVTNNIFWWTNPDAHLLSGHRGTKVKDVVFDGNLYCGTAGVSTNAFSGRSREEWNAEGHDLHSKFADPLFRDPAKGDWRLAPNSPALAMGFAPWDWTFAGVLKDNPKWRAAAMDDSGIPALEDAPKAPRFVRTSYHLDFESLRPGAQKQLGRFVKGGDDGLLVTDKIAAGGKKSLRLVDSPSYKHRWHPHIFTHITCETGSVRIAFSFNVDDKSQPTFEGRDYHPANGAQYAVGPHLSFAKGVVRAHGREIARVAPGVWCSVEILLHVTGPKAGTWSCTVSPQGGAPVTVDGLKVTNQFRTLEWLGFMTNGAEPAVWHLDDFLVEPVKP